MQFLLVFAVALLAGTVGGVVGTGSSIILMPVLVLAYGPLAAVPIMAIAALLGNVGRVIAWRRELAWRSAGAYCITAVPSAALGVHTLLSVPPGLIESVLGVFFLSMVVVRRWLARHQWKLRDVHLMLLGAPMGFLTGFVVSTGPLTIPIFAAAGLERGGLLGTESLGSVAVYATKIVAFQGFGALPWSVALSGLLAGSAMMAGSFIGRHVVLRIAPSVFRLLIDALMVLSGLTLLWAAAR